jgi:hypothetical protein
VLPCRHFPGEAEDCGRGLAARDLVTTALGTGTYVDPRRARATVGNELAFPSPQGAVVRRRNARSAWFDDAARAAGLTPHELRHAAASLAVSAGANVKAVQRMLGHASAAMALDRYADLFDDDLDRLRVTTCRPVADVLRTERPQPGAEEQDRMIKAQARGPVEGVETRGIEPLTPALQNRPRRGLAQWAMTENPS